jgi:stage V sporulation protein G
VDITNITVKLVKDSDDKLQGFCTITFDEEFVVRDLKIILSPKGEFVAMPSRKLTDHCPGCRAKNHLRARFCNDCGHKLDASRAGVDKRGRAKLHTDIAHPINAQARQRIEQQILDAFQEEVRKSKLPGYVAPKLGADYDYEDEHHGYDGHVVKGRERTDEGREREMGG